MNGKNDCYVAKRSCGCITAVVVDIPDLKQMAAIIKVMVEAGLLIERSEAEYVIATPPDNCPHRVRQIPLPLFSGRTNGQARNDDGGYDADEGKADEGLDEALTEAEATGEAMVSAEVAPVNRETGKEDEADDTRLLEAALDLARENGMVSVTLLQQKLHIGYVRAGRLIDELEARGVIGKSEKEQSLEREN